MRIGIDARLWNESGVGRYIKNLVKNLQLLDKKNNYVLFVRDKDCESIKYQVLSSKYKNWKIVKADIQWHSLKEQLLLPKILKKEKLDLIHFPYFSVPIFYNLPFVVTIHDLIINHFPTGQATTLPTPFYKLKLLGYKFIISQVVKKARKIITVSNSTKQEIINHLKVDEDKIVVTYEGVEQKNSKRKSQNLKLKLKTQNFFLYVGNAYPHKNLERLLEAFQLFCHPDPERSEWGRISRDSSPSTTARDQNDIKLVLIGREDYFYKKLKEKVRERGLTKNVVFYGEATDEELTALYQNAQALVFPSLMEGFGLPALEAMANKCLILASNIPALHEVCNDAAIYFDPLNIEDIAEKIKQVCYYDLNHWSKNKEKGLERAKMFSWEKMAKETLKVYQGI